MKVLLTGAHFTPAAATIGELKKYPNIEIIYVGRKTTLEGDKIFSIESKVLPSLGVKFIPIIAGRLQREFTIFTIPSLLKIPIGFLQSFWVVLSQKPDVVLSFGGYVAVPIIFVAWLFSIPIMVHEQTLVSGLANKISAFFADKVAISFENNRCRKEKTILVGNPIRREILHPVKRIPAEYIRLFKYSKKNNLRTILIMGGNQGSHTINITVEEIVAKLTKFASLIHISGNNKYNDFERLEKLQDKKYIVKRWIGEEIGAVLSKVDIVICRAGANTLTELAYLGKPALVIPFEPLLFDEQNKNAKFFESLGLVQILSQSKLSGKSLLENIRIMLNKVDYFKENAKNAKKVIKVDAAKRLALETILLAKHD